MVEMVRNRQGRIKDLSRGGPTFKLVAKQAPVGAVRSIVAQHLERRNLNF